MNEFIDLMLAEWYTEEEKQHFLSALANVDTRAQNTYSKMFANCTAEEQTAILQALEQEYQVQSQCYAFGEATKHFFVNDKHHPYSHDADKPFSWIRGYQLGGRSILWARQCYRLSDLDFEANARDGFGVDWPVRYKDMAPWYGYVEAFAGISGQAEDISQLPDGKFQPPMPMNCVELAFKERMEQKFSGRIMTIGRAAVLTQPKNGRAACHYCGPCERGCSTGSYFSSLSATLPAALATKKLTIRTDSIVHSILYDESKDPKTSVRNAHNQCHDVPNLFVTDGSCMASSACQNPSLTYMAFTARACDYAVRKMKRMNL